MPLRLPIALAILLAVAGCGAKQADKPPLTIMTALPLFGLNGEIGAVLNGPDRRAAIVRTLEGQYRPIPIDHIDAKVLSQATVLILAQPRGLSGAELVELDAWIRQGGKALIFADPLLLWPSDLPLGDRRRAPPVTLLDPLLTHWGLVLDLPPLGTEAVAIASLGKRPLTVAGPGVWQSTGKACAITDDRLVADCRIGSGHALLIADADMLDERLWRESGQDNSQRMIEALDRLETPGGSQPGRSGT